MADHDDTPGPGWVMQDDGGFLALVGPLWRHHDGRRFGFVAGPHHANMVGVVHGGMLMTFADRGLGLMAWEACGDRPVVTIAFDTIFANAARIGSFVELSGEIVRITRDLVFMRGLVMSGETLLASAQGTWKILSARARRPGPGSVGAGEPDPGRVPAGEPPPAAP